MAALELQQREAVIAEAKTWLGTAYHHQGRVKGAGVDCATLLCEVYYAAGVVPYIDPTPYPPDWHMHRSDERYLGWLREYAAPVDAPKPGDVAVWRFGRCFSHGAIVIGGTQIIHSYLKQGCVLADMAHEPLKDRPVMFFSLWKAAS